MLNYNQCYYQYRKALDEYNRFMNSSKAKNMKGYLQYKKNKKKRGDKVYCYDEMYYVYVDYIEHKRIVHMTYVKKSEYGKFIHLVNEKKENHLEYKNLKQNLNKRIKDLIKASGNKNIIDEIDEQIKKQSAYREEEKVSTSILGEGLRSKNECIFANAAFAFGIPYIYEAEVSVTPEIVLHPDFTVYAGNKEILVEILGLTNDKLYIQQWENKESHYREMGYFLGKNLICIKCEDSKSINSQKIVEILVGIKNGKIPREPVFV